MSNSEITRDAPRPNAYNIIERLQSALNDMLTAVEAMEADIMQLHHENENLRHQLQITNDQLQLANSKAASRAGRMPK